MTLNELLRARHRAMRDAIAALGQTARHEGIVYERVRLFDGVRFAWWRRTAKRLTARVLDEVREHEVTARARRLDADDAVVRAWDAMARDAQVALTALGEIGSGQCDDPTETANRALDLWRGSMARFGFLSGEPALRIEMIAEFQRQEDLPVTPWPPRDPAMPDDA